MTHDCFEGFAVLSLDLETTGIESRRDKIVQYAFIGSLSDGTEVNIEELVNPQRAIPHETTAIHGIHNSDVAGLPGFDAHVKLVHEMIEDAVIVGHNVRRFDLGFIDNEYLRLGLSPPKPAAVVDTLEVVRRLKLPKPHNLGALCERYGIELVNAHTAGADAAASLLLLWRLMNDHPSHFRKGPVDIERWLVGGRAVESTSSELGPGLADLEALDRQGRLRKDEGRLILAFGRHRAKSMQEIEKIDPGYLDWLASPGSILEEESRNVVKSHLAKIRSG